MLQFILLPLNLNIAIKVSNTALWRIIVTFTDLSTCIFKKNTLNLQKLCNKPGFIEDRQFGFAVVSAFSALSYLLFLVHRIGESVFFREEQIGDSASIKPLRERSCEILGMCLLD